MQLYKINASNMEEIIPQLHNHFGGTFDQKDGGQTLHFKNEFGHGVIKNFLFDWGVTLIDYDVTFSKDTSLQFEHGAYHSLEFFFISAGKLDYLCDKDGDMLCFNKFQNIILSDIPYSIKTLVFQKDLKTKINFIEIIADQYLLKKNNPLSFAGLGLLPVIKDKASNFIYYHLGNHSLKIAEQVKKLYSDDADGLIRMLSIEGQINLILALQLAEHNEHINKIKVPASLTVADMKQINGLTNYIVENVDKTITLKMLTQVSGLSARKLQLGFHSLNDVTANVFIRNTKLEKATQLLDKNELTISEIVYAIGFSSRSYFSKIFADKYGILPIDYRRNNLKYSIK